MGSLTDYAENKLLDHLFNAAYTSPSAVYLVLCTADPTDSATGASCNEVANANGYARTAISFGAAASRRITQDAQVNFQQATGPLGTITHWALADSATYGAGNILAYGEFSSSFAPVAGNTPRIASGQVYVEISATASGAGFTTATVNSLLGLMFDNTAYASPAGSTYLALLNATASDTTTLATMTEVTGTSYARKEVNESGGASPAWTAASGGALSNATDVVFATPGAGGWSQVVAVGIVTAASGTTGQLLAYDNANVVDQTPAENDTVQFAAGAFDVSLS